MEINYSVTTTLHLCELYAAILPKKKGGNDKATCGS